jgi:hypothetical protein
MEPHHETGFPATLCRWVGEIVQSSPEAARLTLLELIVGALLASGGHVTQAILALTPRLGWQAYHWMLERARFRLLGLIATLCRIVRREIGARRCFVVIDGSLDNAEGGGHWRPGARPRRPVLRSAPTMRPRPTARRYCCASASSRCPQSCRDRPRSVPLVTGLCRGSGNAGKIAMAKGLLRAVTLIAAETYALIRLSRSSALRRPLSSVPSSKSAARSRLVRCSRTICSSMLSRTIRR